MSETRIIPSEHQEQVGLFEWWYRTRWHRAGVVMFAIPNGGWRHIATGKRLKDEGQTPGVPDIFLAYPCEEKSGLFIEMKRQKGGKVSDEQRAMHAALSRAGYSVVVCRGWDSAREVIEAYMKQAEREYSFER